MTVKSLIVLAGLLIILMISAASASIASPVHIEPISTATKIVATFQPSPTRPTVYPVTATASGPLLGVDRNYVGRLMQSVPAQLGGFDAVVVNTGFDAEAFISLSNKENLHLNITLEFARAGTEYNWFRLISAYMPRGQVAAIADGAKVDAQNDQKIAIMFYRNVEITIDAPWSLIGGNEPRPATPPFTNDQLIAILKDLYEKVLKNAP